MDFTIDYTLEQKVAVVAGGAGGLGRVICKGLAYAGATVVLADMDESMGNEIVKEITDQGKKAIFMKLNVTDSKNVDEVFARVEEELGGTDILVNAAGITRRMDFLDFDEEAFDRIMAVNVKGTFLCAKAAARSMSKKGKGKIINIASVGGLVGLRGTMGYCTSKGAVVQMTRSMALDLANCHINVNAVAPALANTAIAAPVVAHKPTYDSFMAHIPLNRLCEPTDVAAAIQFLASPASDFITGHILPVDGGWTTH